MRKYLIIAIVIVSALVGVFAFSNAGRGKLEVEVYKAARMELQKLKPSAAVLKEG